MQINLTVSPLDSLAYIQMNQSYKLTLGLQAQQPPGIYATNASNPSSRRPCRHMNGKCRSISHQARLDRFLFLG